MENNKIQLEIVYKPSTKIISEQINGVKYASFLHSPKVYVVSNIDDKYRTDNLIFIEKNKPNLKHKLYGCIYTDINGLVNIECKHWSIEYNEDEYWSIEYNENK